jgi:TolB-like protein
LRKHKPEEKSEEVIAPKSVLRKDHKIKILAGSLIGLALIVLGILFIPKLFKPSEQIEKSIAVLPFINDSPDEGNEYFCNGMMEEIMNHLQNIGGLKVKSRTSVEKYRNLQKDIKDIGHELDVSFILEGSVRKSGDDLRIATQLIDAKTGDHLWSHIYNGKYTDRIFEFQSDVSRKVAESLHAVISPEEERRIDSKPTSEIMAYDLCSRGNEMLAKWDYTYDSVYLRSALNLFNRALKIDPEFPDAFSGKGRAYNLSGNYDSAMFYYKRVELLDPHNINSAYGIGVVYMYSGKPDSALKYLEKVVKSIPDNCAYNISTGQVLLLLNSSYKCNFLVV